MCASKKHIFGFELQTLLKAVFWGFSSLCIGIISYTIYLVGLEHRGITNTASIEKQIKKGEERDLELRKIEAQVVINGVNIKWIRENLNDGKFYKRSNRP